MSSGSFSTKSFITVLAMAILNSPSIFCHMEPEPSRNCFFAPDELAEFMGLVRMNKDPENDLIYTRLISGNDGFTPPGMMMGLTYAWYLDSRFGSHVDYKMAIAKVPVSDLVMEQGKILHRRDKTIRFFREVVFRHTFPVYDGKTEDVV